MLLSKWVGEAELPKAWMGVLCTGLFIQMVGGLFIVDGSRHATWQYLLLFVPALVLLLGRHLSTELWRQPSGWLLLALMAWVLVSGLLQGDDRFAGSYWPKVVLLGLLYVYAVAMVAARPRVLSGLMAAAVVVAAFFAWFSLCYQFGVLERPLDYWNIRVLRIFEVGWKGFADLKNPVVAGIYFGIFLTLAVYFFVASQMRSWLPPLLLLAGLGLAGYVFVAFSRGAWFAVLTASFVALLLHPGRKSQVLLIAGLLGLLGVLWVFWSELDVEKQIGLSGRDQIWLIWLERLPDFWLWGAGAGHAFKAMLGEVPMLHAHSLYLQFWYEYGLIGFLLLLGLLAALLWKGWQCREQLLARIGLVLLVYAMVAMLTDVDAIISRPSEWWTLFWLPVGILLGIPRQESSRTAPFKAS